MSILTIMMRQALLLTASVLLMGTIVAVVITVACGDGNGLVDSTKTPVINDVTSLSGDGQLDDLQTSAAQVGDEIVVTGSGWTPSVPVGFYLLTKEQSRGPFDQRHAIRFGEVTPEEDGGVSFRFRLASSYETPSGDQVRIEAGQQWHIWAFQKTEGGSQGTGVGPLTVR